MILEISPKLTLDTINKSLRTSEIPIEEDFELKLYNKNSVLMVAFIPNLSKANKTMKKYSGKKNIIYFYCA